MDVSNLPLLELFTRLQDAGLPLGIDEYKLVLKSLQGGFGIRDKAALKRLCQTLWVKSNEEKALFEFHFEEVIGGEDIASNSKKSVKKFYNKNFVKKLPNQFNKFWNYASLFFIIIGIGFALKFIFVDTQQVQKAPQQPVQNQDVVMINSINLALIFIGTSIPIYVVYQQIFKRNREERIAQKKIVKSTIPLESTQIVEDEIQVVQAVLQSMIKNQKIIDYRFILSGNLFPVTERQMKHNWRYLRRMMREGQMTELDVEATVEQIGRQGLLLSPVFVPRLVNKVELLLLIDQDGSMVPFHALSRRFKETLLGGRHLGKVAVYYFHNCPGDYLYNDPSHQKAELISNILNYEGSDRTEVLIFSDAGAARGGYSEERFNLTREFISKLQKRVRYIAWLNPVPKERWSGTTALDIARLAPMFEVSRRGMQNAINVLQGREYG